MNLGIQLKRQLVDYELKINQYEKTSEKLSGERDCQAKIAEGGERHIQNCRKRVEIAKGIDVQAFLKLDIEERTSAANEVFKWMMVALYG